MGRAALLLLLLALTVGLAHTQCSLVGTWAGEIEFGYDDGYSLLLTLSANGTAAVTSKWTTSCSPGTTNQCVTYLDGTYTATSSKVFVDLTCSGGSGGDCCPCEGGLTLPLSYGDWSPDCNEVTVGIFGEDVRLFRQ